MNISTMTTKAGTKLSSQDVAEIIDLVNNGVAYLDIAKKYKIGTNRLYKILQIHNCYSLHTKKGREEYIKSTEVSPKDNINNDIYQNLLEGVSELRKKQEKRKS